MSKKKSTNDVMANMVIAVVVSLLVGLGAGYVLADPADDTPSTVSEITEHDHSNPDDHDDGEAHSHSDSATIEVSAGEAPTVSLIAEEDAKSGWNLTLVTTNWTFTPENINGANSIGQGHAHLYVDGEKVARLYGPNYHYDENFDGEREFRVTLNANDHSEYAVDNRVIEAFATIEHQAHD